MEVENTVLDVILKYIKKTKITINTKEFTYKFKTHPKYPLLVSITETLEYFNIDFSVYETSIEDIDNNIVAFFTILKDEENQVYPSLIEKKSNKYKSNSLSISKKSLKHSWKGIILILEENKPLKKSSLKKKIGTSILFSFLVYFFLNFETGIFDFGFFILIIFGLSLSTVALTIFFKINSTLAGKICNISPQGNCDSIINTKKWKLFEIINFTDLSFIFFVSQILIYFLAIIMAE